MTNEIIYVCNSINNKNVRDGELNILEKFENELYFIFGSDKMNIKKRFYNDLETLNKDFDALLKIKKETSEKAEKAEKAEKEKKLEEIVPLETAVEADNVLNKIEKEEENNSDTILAEIQEQNNKKTAKKKHLRK